MNIVAVVKAFIAQSAGAALLLISLKPVLSLCTAGSLLCATGGPDPLAWVAFGAGFLLIGQGTWLFFRMARGTEDDAGEDCARAVFDDSPAMPLPEMASDEPPPELEAAPAPMPGRRRAISASAMAEAD